MDAVESAVVGDDAAAVLDPAAIEALDARLATAEGAGAWGDALADGCRLYLRRLSTRVDDDIDLVPLLAFTAVLQDRHPVAIPPAAAEFVQRLRQRAPDQLDTLAQPSAWHDLAIELADDGRHQDALVVARTLLRLTIAGLPVRDGRRTIAAVNLSGQLLRAAVAGGADALLDDAATVCRTALTDGPVDDPQRGGLTTNLTTALLERYERTGDAGALRDAVAVARRGVEHALISHAPIHDLAQAHASLGLTLRATADHDSSVASLDDAIDALRRAVDATAADDPDRASRLSNLANALRARFELTDDRGSLTEAVSAARAAADACPPDARTRSAIHTNLGAALLALHDATALDEHLVDAVTALRTGVVAAGDSVGGGPLSNLGLALKKLGERTADLDVLAEAVDTAAAAVDAAGPTHRDRAGHLINLGIAALALADHGGDAACLDRSVTALEAARDALPHDHPDHTDIAINLCSALLSRGERRGSLADLDAAVDAGREACGRVPTGAPSRAAALSNLGAALLALAERTDSWDDVVAAVDAARQAVAATPRNHPLLPRRQMNLALALRDRYGQRGEPHVLDEAIGVARRAADGTGHQGTAGHVDPLHAGALSNLSLVLRADFERRGDLGALDGAITAARAAVEATPLGHPDRPGFLTNLGNALGDRFERLGDADALDEAVAVAQTAVDTTPDGHPGLPGYLSNLGNALHNRYTSTGRLADLDAAVDVARRAAAAVPHDGLDRAGALSNLAGALHARYRHTGALASLTGAVAAGRQAASSMPDDHPGRAVVLLELSNILQAQAERQADRGALEEAIDASREGLRILPDGHVHRATLLSGLADALLVRYLRTADLGSLREAVAQGSAAVEATPPDDPARGARLSNLSVGLRTLHERTGDGDALAEAVTAARQAVATLPAGHPEHATTMVVLADALATHNASLDEVAMAETLATYRQAAQFETATPTIRVRAAESWGRLAATVGDIEQGRDGLGLAVQLLEQVAPRDLQRPDQERRLAQFAGLASDAAACAVALGDPDGAVALLELGRGVLLSQAMTGWTPVDELESEAPDLARRYSELRALLDDPGGAGAISRVRGGGTSSASEVRTGIADVAVLAERRRALVDEMNAVLASIRAVDGFERFQLPPDVAELRGAAGDGPVVLVNTSRFGCHAVIVTPQVVETVDLPALDVTAVTTQVRAFRGALHATAAPPDIDAVDRSLREVLVWLWDVIAEPVLAHLGFTTTPPPAAPWPRLWWSATGPLALLPLHAAGRDDVDGAAVYERVVSSWTPTIRALIHARRSSADAVELRGCRALVVAMQTTAGQPALPGTLRETALLRALFGERATVLSDAQAVSDQVLDHLPDHQVVHFAGHGVVDPSRPSASHLLTRDHQEHPLTVTRVSGLRLRRGELAFLSACGTAQTGAALVDEVINLASAFQLAGYRHVIGTLWPVPDRVAVRIARGVYAHVAAGNRIDLAPVALHATARALRRRWPDRPSIWAAHVHAGAARAM